LVKAGPASGTLKSSRRTNSRERLRTGGGLASGASSNLKARKAKSSGGTKSAKNFKKENQVHGNRHLTACCNHLEANGKKPQVSPIRRAKRSKSPGYKHEREFRNMNEEKSNYTKHIEEKYSLMLEEEKDRLRREMADHKDVVSKQLRFEMEE